MPISTLLAAAPGAASSADQIIADGAALRFTVTGQGSLLLEPKLPTGYGPGEEVGGAGIRSGYLYGPLTFRATRPADSSAGLAVETA